MKRRTPTPQDLLRRKLKPKKTAKASAKPAPLRP
jgi:hypothetical protein